MNSLYTLMMLFVGWTPSFQETQATKVETKDEYHIKNNLLNGKYVSYHANGKKKSEGMFANNVRIGEWKIWDESGNLHCIRNYSGPLSFVQKLAQTGDGKTFTEFKQEKTAETYPKISNPDVVYSMRIWKEVYFSANEILGSADQFEKNLIQFLTTNAVKVFDAQHDDFTQVLSTIPALGDAKIVGFKLKQDYFYDNKRQLMEARVVGICPLLQTTGKDAITSFGWIYYPNITAFFQDSKVDDKFKVFPQMNLDDVIHYNCLSTTIYKESNVNDLSISQYKTDKTLEEIQTQIILSLVETEHDYWLKQH